MPRLAAFPKAWMDGLCVDGSVSLERWIEMASTLDIDGLEFYSGFLDLRDSGQWRILMKRAMKQNFSVVHMAMDYISLYRQILYGNETVD